MDEPGTMGHAYGAKTTPHMYIIDPTGKVVYNGAIDDQPKTEESSLAGATNFVDRALSQLFAGQPVSPSTSTPYGCEVHYAG